jgi:hypothetical protein
MWPSEKKKGILMFSAYLNKNIILGCYNCIKDRVAKNPSIFTDTLKVDL